MEEETYRMYSSDKNIYAILFKIFYRQVKE
jgi:hypothetical protein